MTWQEEELSKNSVAVFANDYGHGVLERRPEDSVYWHPTLNPQGLPPAGKPQRYKTGPSVAAQKVRTPCRLSRGFFLSDTRPAICYSELHLQAVAAHSVITLWTLWSWLSFLQTCLEALYLPYW